jgi:hypothetical protein
MEAWIGFEPMKNAFAMRPFRPLRHRAIKREKETIVETDGCKALILESIPKMKK